MKKLDIKLVVFWLSLVIIDRATKIIALNYSYVKNTGIAFGFLKGQNSLLMMLSVFLFVIFLLLFFKSNKLKKISLILILAGIFSNLIDRVFHGYVIDFINILALPVFNLGDFFIVAGLIMFFVLIVADIIKKKDKKTKKTRK